MKSATSNQGGNEHSTAHSAFLMKLVASNKAAFISAIRFLRKFPSSLHRTSSSAKLGTYPMATVLYHNCGSSDCAHNSDLCLDYTFFERDISRQSSSQSQGKPSSELWDSGYSSDGADSIIDRAQKDCPNVSVDSLDNCSINATVGSPVFQARVDDDGWMPAEDYERLQIQDPNHPLPRVPTRHLQGVFRKIQDENTPIDYNNLYEQQCKKIHQMHKMLGLPPPSFVPKFRE